MQLIREVTDKIIIIIISVGDVFLCSCVFVILPYGVLDQVWYLIVSIPDLG